MGSYWSERVERLQLRDCWGADITVSDDPEVGIIIEIARTTSYPDHQQNVLLSGRDWDEISAAVARVEQSRPGRQAAS